MPAEPTILTPASATRSPSPDQPVAAVAQLIAAGGAYTDEDAARVARHYLRLALPGMEYARLISARDVHRAALEGASDA